MVLMKLLIMKHLQAINVHSLFWEFLFFGGSIIATPTNYGNANLFVDNYSISGGKFPATDVIKDNYQIWLRQNALNLQIGVARWCCSNSNWWNSNGFG